MGTARLRRQVRDVPRPAQVGTEPLPGRLRAGIESLSGFALDDVRVHYRSPEPSRVGALAFAQGQDIHVAPGQEQHLAHEAWHVVQQAQGRVAPTTRIRGGVVLNDDSSLELEAERMGERATRIQRSSVAPGLRSAAPAATVRQLMNDGTKEGLTTLKGLNAKMKSASRSPITKMDFEEKLDWTPTDAEFDKAVAASTLVFSSKTPLGTIVGDLVTQLNLAKSGGGKKAKEAAAQKKSPREEAAWASPKFRASKGFYYGGGANELHVHDVKNDAFLKGPGGRKPFITAGVLDARDLADARASLKDHGQEKPLNAAIDRALLENKKDLDN